MYIYIGCKVCPHSFRFVETLVEAKQIFRWHLVDKLDSQCHTRSSATDLQHARTA